MTTSKLIKRNYIHLYLANSPNTNLFLKKTTRHDLLVIYITKLGSPTI